jgi:hypothetical protein
MKPPRSRRKCLNCKGLFLPDYRSAQRARYCLKPECRKARKRELMRAWLAKAENQNYFRDTQNAERVRDWQKEHPGYWKNTARYRRRTLQDDCSEPVRAQVVAADEVAPHSPSRTLQDLCSLRLREVERRCARIVAAVTRVDHDAGDSQAELPCEGEPAARVGRRHAGRPLHDGDGRARPDRFSG